VPHVAGLVVDGPPGTGKSQLLANLLAAAAIEGTSVLVVTAVPGALHVLSERLAGAGLGSGTVVSTDGLRGQADLARQLERALSAAPSDADSGNMRAAYVRRRLDLVEKEIDERTSAMRSAHDLWQSPCHGALVCDVVQALAGLGSSDPLGPEASKGLEEAARWADLAELDDAIARIGRIGTIGTADPPGPLDAALLLAAQGQAEAGTWERQVRRIVYETWLCDALDGATLPVSRQGHEAQSRRLRELLTSRRDLVRALGAYRPRIPGAPGAKAALASVKRQLASLAKSPAASSRTQGSLRTTLSAYAPMVLSSIPCWLMTPDAAARYLPLEPLFDLLVIDEASQLRLEEAAPLLVRARRAVFAGDPQQMPPARFFEAGSDSEDDETREGEGEGGNDAGTTTGGASFEFGASGVMDAVAPPRAENVESVLEAATRAFPTASLRFHYRSRAPELMEFSNHAFYGGALHLVPGPATAAEPALRFEQATGLWQDRRNLPEAATVARAVRDCLLQNTDPPTVAILAMNALQADAIEDALEELAATQADFGTVWERALNDPLPERRPIVASVSSMQGAERDVVFMSIGFGPDREGRLRRNYGPVSHQGGERRLNVAITRARSRMMVFASFDPDEIAAPDRRSRGPFLLHRFLSYAKAVTRRNAAGAATILEDVSGHPVAVPVTSAPTRRAANVLGPRIASDASFDSPFEEEVFDRLEQAGFRVSTQVGTGPYRIDLAVEDPDDPSRFCVGIECDGASFHALRSVRERDVARQAFLESRGWHIVRVWSTDWWADPDAELERLVRAIREQARRPMEATPAAAAKPSRKQQNEPHGPPTPAGSR
jgi:very-short-patch-repair endonuclease